MKNILGNGPHETLHGRPRYCTTYVLATDIDGKTVLDIGCGFGWFLLSLIDKGAEKIIGVEPNVEGLPAIGLDLMNTKLALVAASGANLPFRSESFETVTCWEVLEHIPRGQELMLFREIWRLLKPGGAFYLSTPYDSPASKFLDPAWWLAGHRHYSLESLAAYAKAVQLQTEDTKIVGGYWELFGMINLYIAKWIFFRRPFFEEYFTKKQDGEFSRRNGGFATIFMRFRKSV